MGYCIKMPLTFSESGGKILFTYNCNLNNPIKLILKNIISLFDILECEAAGYERRSVNLVLSDKKRFEQKNNPTTIVSKWL